MFTCIGCDLDDVDCEQKATELDVSDCTAVTELSLSKLVFFPNLTKLDLSRCEIHDLAHVAQVPTLKEIKLNSCPITDQGLEHLTQLGLELLDVSNCRMITSTGLVHISKIASLTELDLGYCVGASGFECLLSLRNLKKLVLEVCSVGDLVCAILAQFPAIEELNLTDTAVTEEGLEHLSKLPLKTLIVQGCSVGDSSLKHVPPTVTHLDLFMTEITDAGIKELHFLPDLETLDVACCQVTDQGVFYLTKFTKLHTLQLYETQITDACAEILASMVSLQKLYLGKTKVSDKSLSTLAKLVNLTTLALAHCDVTDRGLAHLENLNNLRSIDVEDCRVSRSKILSLEQNGLEVIT